MIGIGSPDFDVAAYGNRFVSALGSGKDSWGLSYHGTLQHEGVTTDTETGKFSRGDIVGCLLDLWHGTLTFYINRKPVGGTNFRYAVFRTVKLCLGIFQGEASTHSLVLQRQGVGSD